MGARIPRDWRSKPSTVVLKRSRSDVATIRRFNRRARRGLNVRAASSATNIRRCPHQCFAALQPRRACGPGEHILSEIQLQSKPSHA